jgi:polyphosphate kinase
MRQRVIDECLVPYLLDSLDAWDLDAHGHYQQSSHGGLGAQAALMVRHGM